MVTDKSWLVKPSATKCHLHFTLTSTLYDIDVLVYKIETKFAFVRLGFSWFIYYWKMVLTDKTDIAFLYRVVIRIAPYLPTIFWYQAVAQLIIDRKEQRWHAVVRQHSPINGHPWIDQVFWPRTCIGMDEAISIVRSMTAYIFPAILASREKWPLEFCKKWFLAVPIIVKNWTAKCSLLNKDQHSKSSMRRSRTAWHTWISAMDLA